MTPDAAHAKNEPRRRLVYTEKTSIDAKMHTENLRYINHTKNNSNVVSLDA